MLVTWTDLEALLPAFPELAKLSLASNSLGEIDNSPTWFQTLHVKTIDLSSNNITSLSDLRFLKANDDSHGLQSLSLRSNPLTTITTISTPDSSSPLETFHILHHLDLAQTLLPSFATLNPLSSIAPHLSSLITTNSPLASLPDARLETIARIGSLKQLNFSPVGEKDRMNAEIWYLSRIASSSDAISRAKQDEEEEFRRWVGENHPRYWKLCEVYGEPEGLAAARASGGKEDGDGIAAEGAGQREMAGPMKKGTLGARLVTMTFISSMPSSVVTQRENPSSAFSADSMVNEQPMITIKVPPSISITALKARVIPVFFPSSPSKAWINPFKYRLVWETGEYDPPGYRAPTMQNGGDWSDEDENEDLDEGDGADDEDQRKKMKKRKEDWVQREVELTDGAKDVGYWIKAGGEARVRVDER